MDESSASQNPANERNPRAGKPFETATHGWRKASYFSDAISALEPLESPAIGGISRNRKAEFDKVQHTPPAVSKATNTNIQEPL